MATIFTVEVVKKHIAIATRAVELCEEAIAEGDPRASSSLEHYQKQLKELQDKLVALESGRPPDIVIGLKTAELHPKKGALNG